jgi:hypothetical protein
MSVPNDPLLNLLITLIDFEERSESATPLRLVCFFGEILTWSASNICYMLALMNGKPTDSYVHLFLPTFFNLIAVLIVEVLLAGVVSANGTGFWGKVFAVQYYGALVAQLAVAAKVLMAQVWDNVTLFWKHWKKYRGD